MYLITNWPLTFKCCRLQSVEIGLVLSSSAITAIDYLQPIIDPMTQWLIKSLLLQHFLMLRVERSVLPTRRGYLIFERPLLQEAFIVTGGQLVPLSRRPGRHRQQQRQILVLFDDWKSSKVKKQPACHFRSHIKTPQLPRRWLAKAVGGSYSPQVDHRLSGCQEFESSFTFEQ